MVKETLFVVFIGHDLVGNVDFVILSVGMVVLIIREGGQLIVAFGLLEEVLVLLLSLDESLLESIGV